MSEDKITKVVLNPILAKESLKLTVTPDNINNTKITLVRKFDDALKVINDNKFIGFDGRYYDLDKEVQEGMPYDVNSGLNSSQCNKELKELEYLKDELIESNKNKDKAQYADAANQIKEIQKDILYGKHDFYSNYYSQTKFTFLDRENTGHIFSTCFKLIKKGTGDILEYNKIPGTKLVTNSTYAYCIMEDEKGKICILKDNLNKLLSEKLKYKFGFDFKITPIWLDSNGFKFIIIFKRKQEFIARVYDSFSEYEVKLSGFFGNTLKPLKEEDGRIKKIGLNIGEKPYFYIAKYDSNSKNWLILNRQKNKNKDICYKAYIINDITKELNVIDLDIDIEHFHLTNNTKIAYYNNQLFIPYDGKIIKYDLLSMEITPYFSSVITCNSKLDVINNGDDVLIYEQNCIFNFDLVKKEEEK